MNIATIRAAMNDQLDVYAGIYGESTTLTPAQNTEVTDAGAGILATVNPTNNYPPVKK